MYIIFFVGTKKNVKYFFIIDTDFYGYIFMETDKYWSAFRKIDHKWHYLMGLTYGLLSLFTLITNGFVLFFLIKYAILFNICPGMAP